MRLFSSIVAICLLVLGGVAQAALVTIEPDDYAVGSVIGPTPEATVSFMSHVVGDPDWTFKPALAALGASCDIYPSCGAVTGTNVFWDGTVIDGKPYTYDTYNLGPGLPFIVQPPGTTIAQRTTFSALRVDFTTPTDFFSADMLGASDLPYIMTFATDGSVLSRGSGYQAQNYRQFDPGCTTPNSSCRAYDQSVSVQHSSADIAFILIGGSGAGSVVDAVRFNVPEPSSTALLALGVVVMLGAAKRGKRTVVDRLRLVR